MRKLAIMALALLAVMACGAKEEQKVVLGDEQFDKYIPLLEGQRVAVFSNQTGIVGDKVLSGGIDERYAEALARGENPDRSLIPFGQPVTGQHVLDALIEKGVNVTAIFSPEHGFRGNADAGEHVSSSVDEVTGVPIVSLYDVGKHTAGEDNMSMFDVLVVDIQDVGLRFYTYYVTMKNLMDVCAQNGKKVIVLDRPNPNGFYVDGPILDMRFKSGVGALPIPVVHGLTLGEMALMINGEGWLTDGIKADLTVIPCLNYSHQTKYSLILAPSPNIKDMKAVYFYPSTCYFEGTVISLGRGTDFPFEAYGHPDMKDCTFTFTPRSIPGAKNPPLLDQECQGVDLRQVPDEEIWAGGVDLKYLVDAYDKLGAGEDFFIRNNFFNRLVGTDYVYDMILEGASADEIKARWQDDVATFKEQRKPYLLYAE